MASSRLGRGSMKGFLRAAFRLGSHAGGRHPPARMTREELNLLVEAVEAPWGARIERQIRKVLAGANAADSYAGGRDPTAVSAALATRIRELGLRPFRATRASAADRGRGDPSGVLDGRGHGPHFIAPLTCHFL